MKLTLAFALIAAMFALATAYPAEPEVTNNKDLTAPAEISAGDAAAVVEGGEQAAPDLAEDAYGYRGGYYGGRRPYHHGGGYHGGYHRRRPYYG